jgi:hypothetical protein
MVDKRVLQLCNSPSSFSFFNHVSNNAGNTYHGSPKLLIGMGFQSLLHYSQTVTADYAAATSNTLQKINRVQNVYVHGATIFTIIVPVLPSLWNFNSTLLIV